MVLVWVARTQVIVLHIERVFYLHPAHIMIIQLNKPVPQGPEWGMPVRNVSCTATGSKVVSMPPCLALYG